MAAAVKLEPKHFNPRSPRGGATSRCNLPKNANKFQSTLPTRGSDQKVEEAEEMTEISIHAPHEGERLYSDKPTQSYHVFQSTLPTRGSDAKP